MAQYLKNRNYRQYRVHSLGHFGGPGSSQIMAQYLKIESIGSIGSIIFAILEILAILEVQVPFKIPQILIETMRP